MKEFMFFLLIIIVLHINNALVEGNSRDIRADPTLDGNSNVTNKELEETFELLNQGEKLIELNDEYRDAIIVLGNTGAGKSTFTQWIAGDDTKLISVKDPKTLGGFIIHDNNTKIGNSTITSKTIFPELLVDPETNAAFYDFPGFHDTRGVANDIATTYFIKKVVDHTRSVKLLFIVNYNSLTGLGTRQDFTDLLRHATDLIKDFDKFRNSIGIVASKVKNEIDTTASSAEGKLVYFDDKSVIGSIASFMEGVKQDLMNDVTTKSGLSEKDKTYYTNAIKCIDILLIKDDDNYSRIGLFRVPDGTGPLSNITSLQQGKKHIKTLLYKNLEFTTKSVDDFGYTIPNESKNDIGDIIEAINQNIWYDLSNITTLADNYYHDLVQQIYMKINSFVTSIDPVDAHPEEAQTWSSKLNNGHNSTIRLMKDIEDLTNPEQLAEKINVSCSSSGILVPGAIILDLSNQGQYLEFLKTFSDKILPMKQWASLFQSIVSYLEDSKKNVQDNVKYTAKDINGNIKVEIENTAEAVEKHYEERMKMFEIQELSAELQKGCSVMLETTKKIGNSTTSEELANIIRSGMNILGIIFPKQTFLRLKNQGRYLEFLQIMSETELYLGMLTLKTPFEDLLKNLHESLKWYTFLDSLYEKFSSYEIQSERRKYDVANIEDWGEEGKLAGIRITQDSFKIFIQKITKYNITEIDEVKNIKATDLQLDALNQVLSSTLRFVLNKFCPTPDRLVVTGDFVKLSDISMNECSETLKYVEISVFNKFFIDTNFIHIGGQIQLSIISPTWQTVNNHKIILDGSPGQDHAQKSAITTNVSPGGKGADGQPGLPGGPGGNFFGVGHTFKNSEWLSISGNGGRGGNGQIGGIGMKGLNGKEPYVPQEGTTGKYSGWIQHGFKVILLRRTRVCSGFGVGVPHCVLTDYGTWGVYGTNCSDGGSGGDGGQGGYGGNPGKISVIELAPGTTLSIKNRTGETGSDGVGGNGGKPGESGGQLIVEEKRYGALKDKGTYTVESRTTFPSCQAGASGNSGLNRNNLKDSEQTQFLHPSYIVNDYKKYLRENIGSSLIKSFSCNFLKQLEDSQSVRDLYDVSGFINELYILESQYHNLHNKISFLPFYQSLLNRVDEYIASKSLNYDKVLDYLRIAIFSKINSIQNDSENYIVVDIKTYFTLVENHIEKYKTTLKEIKINTYRNQYKDILNTQIAEANMVIEQIILPAIDDVYSQIDNEISSLIQHIISMQNTAEKNQEKALRELNELTRQLPLMGFLGALKFTSQLLAFTGPVGVAASGVIEVGTGILSPRQDTKGLLASADKSLQQITNYYKNEQKVLKLNLDLAEQQLSKDITDKNNEDLKNVQKEIATVKDNFDKNNFSPNNFLGMKERLKDFAKREEELAREIESKPAGKNEKSKFKEKSKVKFQIAGKLRNAITLAETGLDSSKRYKELGILMSEAGDKVNKIGEEIDALKQYENSIYHTMVPVRKSLEEGLKEMETQSSNASSVGLDITKWQIQNTIRDFQLKMQDMLEASNNATIESKFKECVDKLQGSMFTMIQIYDRIQDYQGQARLANYIADLSSGDQITTNQELSAEINQLELITQSNLILYEYEKASSAFKQYIFPFASLYLDKFDLSPYVHQAENISDLVLHARNQLEFLTDELTKSATVIRKTPYRIFPDITFDTENIEKAPFIIWKHSSNKYEISKLLQGQKIILSADITKGVKQNAIKFNEIGIQFITANKTIQGELDQHLVHYLVGMNHLGNSHYRCDDKYYIITHNMIDMKHSVNKNKGGHFYQLDETSKIVRNNNPLFSPYTQWEIQLFNKDTKGHNFEELKKYANQEIDLTLEGHGQYVEMGIDMCKDKNLKNYYNVYSYV